MWSTVVELIFSGAFVLSPAVNTVKKVRTTPQWHSDNVISSMLIRILWWSIAFVSFLSLCFTPGKTMSSFYCLWWNTGFVLLTLTHSNTQKHQVHHILKEICSDVVQLSVILLIRDHQHSTLERKYITFSIHVSKHCSPGRTERNESRKWRIFLMFRWFYFWNPTLDFLRNDQWDRLHTTTKMSRLTRVARTASFVSGTKCACSCSLRKKIKTGRK